MVRGSAETTPNSAQLQRRVSWMDRSAGPPAAVGLAGGQGGHPAPAPGPRFPSPSTSVVEESQTPRPATYVKTHSQGQGNQRAVYPLPPSNSSELLRSTLKNAQRRSQTIIRDGSGYQTTNSGKSTPKTASLDLVSLSVSTARGAGSNPNLGGRRRASVEAPQSPAAGPVHVAPIRMPDRRSSIDNRRSSLSAPRPPGLANGFSQKSLVPSYRHFQLVEASTPLASATPKSPFHGQFGPRAAASQDQDPAQKPGGIWGWMSRVANKITAPFRTPKGGRPLPKRRFSVKNPEEAAREKAGW